MQETPKSHDARSLAELAQASAGGDKQAFEALHKRLTGGLRKLFSERSGGKLDIVDDLIQRTWIGVWQALSAGRYDPTRAAISTFVYAVAHNMWLQHLRARPSHRGEPDLEHEGPPDSSDLELTEVLDAVRACLRGEAGGLSTDERAILRLSGRGASDRDLAARLSVSPSTANARKRAAFDKLRKHLIALGLSPDSAERASPDSQ